MHKEITHWCFSFQRGEQRGDHWDQRGQQERGGLQPTWDESLQHSRRDAYDVAGRDDSHDLRPVRHLQVRSKARVVEKEKTPGVSELQECGSNDNTDGHEGGGPDSHVTKNGNADGERAGEVVQLLAAEQLAATPNAKPSAKILQGIQAGEGGRKAKEARHGALPEEDLSGEGGGHGEGPGEGLGRGIWKEL